ncbi:putative Ig domain-containing protein [Acaryochloris marina]|uniref:putative Ig domain-containing protein n=1 Tax=Acaryochloris marina TaxID=155978 RepID=UPI001BAEFBC7|nr:putative Ig domain-containing protein [Acaryochloris marina]QUY45864.1 putative Ig domain-containing protein [Acaryochloris marina S15]
MSGSGNLFGNQDIPTSGLLEGDLLDALGNDTSLGSVLNQMGSKHNPAFNDPVNAVGGSSVNGSPAPAPANASWNQTLPNPGSISIPSSSTATSQQLGIGPGQFVGNASTVSTDDLVMHLTLDETTGQVAADTSPEGRNNRGFLRHGAQFVDVGGSLGGGVEFDGRNDYLAVKDTRDINLGTHAQRTVSIWFKTDTLQAGKQVIYEEGGSTRGLNIYLDDGHLYVGGWNRKQSNWNGTFLSTDQVEADTWHHVSLILDAQAGQNHVQQQALSAYLDGEQFDSGAGAQLKSHSNDIGIGGVNQSTRFHDGKGYGRGTRGLDGIIADARVYNRALSDLEIEQLANINPADQDPPVISASLANDTAANGTNTDGLTFDPTVVGQISDASQITSFRAGLNNTPIDQYVDVLGTLQSDGTFVLDQATLNQINGGVLPDGTYTLNLLATDAFGNSNGGEVFNGFSSLDAEAFQLPGDTSGTVTAKFTWVEREASFDNELGLFHVDDAEGRIGHLKPGDKGYAKAALSSASQQVIFASGLGEGAVTELDLPADGLVGFYIIQDNTTEQFLKRNPKNRTRRHPKAFFSFTAANPDHFDHMQVDENEPNLLRFEDLLNGGDQDFTDVVAQIEIEGSGTVQPYSLPFVLDTTIPAPSFDLAPESDTDPVGDQQTTLETVRLVGTTEANASVVLNPLGQTVVADGQGQFAFEDVPLDIGTNALSAVATDAAGNQSQFSQTIERIGVGSPPEITAPATVTGAEDTDLLVNGISISDADAGSNALEVSLTVNHGVLNFAQTNGLTFSVGDGTADPTAVFTGTLSDINTALDNLTYRAEADFNGSDAIAIAVNDQSAGNGGNGFTDTQTVDIAVTPVNDAPLLTVPGAQAVDENTDLVVSGISINDVDVDSGELEVTLSATNGVMSLSQITGLAFTQGDGITDSTLIFRGTLSDINQALSNLIYRGNANYNGFDTLSIAVNDLGNTGEGGALTDSTTINIAVAATNSAPVADPDKTLTVAEDSGATPLAINAPTDSDGDVLTVTVDEIPDSSQGVVQLAGAALVVGQQLSTSDLEDLEFVPGNDEAGAAGTFSYTVSDGQGGTDSQAVVLEITPVNDAPELIVPLTSLSVAEETDLTIAGISLTDVDAGTGLLEVSITVDSGVLSLSQTNGLTFITGDGVSDVQMAFTGALADINQAVSDLVYRSEVNFDGTANIFLEVNDQGNTGEGGLLTDAASIAIAVNSTNVAPTVDPDKTLMVLEDSVANPLGITAPVDADGDALTLQVSEVPDPVQGEIQLADGTAVVLDQALTIIELEGLVFVPVLDAVGTAGQFSYRVSDGQGGISAQAITLDISAVNDGPGIILPTAASVDEDTDLVMSGITISDVDVNGGEVIVTLTVDNGVLSLGQTSGLTFSQGDGSANGSMVFSGTLANINQALVNLTYRGNLNFDGADVFTVSVDDQGQTGAGGQQINTETLGITVDPVNDLPIVDNDKVITASNDGTLAPLDITAPTDVDGDVLTITVAQLPLADQGIVRLADGTTLTLGQTLSLNELESLEFLPQPGTSGAAGAFSYTVSDGQGGTDSQTISFNISSLIVLQEGTNFTTTAEQAITIPSNTAELRFTYSDLIFDTSDPDFINDAFEVALVDGNGNSLIHTIGSNQDAFLNMTEGFPAELAPGVRLEGQTVIVNLAGLAPGTEATLVFRLVNDDSDVTTSVQINDIEVQDSTGSDPVTAIPDTPLVTGVDPIDFSLLSDVTFSTEVEYQQTSFNEKSQILTTEVTLRNISTIGLDGPLLVAVTNLSNPTVRVVDADGLTADGRPYFDFTSLVTAGKFNPDDLTGPRTISFRNPEGVQFSYDFVVLSELNSNPVIESTPRLEAIAGLPYTYDVNAADPNGDTLTYELLIAPDGMTIEPTTGVISWDTTVADIANHDITVQVSDSRGGITSQDYTLGVIEAPPNRPPSFKSIPIVDANVSADYQYQLSAEDADGDSLTFSIVSGPQNMSIDSNTGLISWRPDNTQLGFNEVVVLVDDSQGGTAEQAYGIFVQAEAGNNAPIIISSPDLKAFAGTSYLTDIDALDPDGDVISYSLLTAPLGLVINSDTGQISWDVTTQDIGIQTVEIQVEDNRGGVETQQFILEVVDLTSSGVIQGTKFHDLDRDGERGFQEGGTNKPSDPNEDTILLLRGDVAVNVENGTVLPVLENLGYEVIVGSLLNPGTIANTLATNDDINQVWIWNDGFGITSANPAFSFTDEDLNALQEFSSEHPNFIFDGLAWRIHSTQDEENLTINQAVNLFDNGGGIVLGTDDSSSSLIVQHVNEVATFFGFETFEGIYSTQNIDLKQGGTLFNSPNPVITTELRSSTTTYSEIPNGEQPNGRFLSTSVFGSPSVPLRGFGSPPLPNDTFNGVEFANVNHLITSTIPGAGIDPIPEPGLEGWIIYIDQNLNGIRDSSERFTTTDVQGNYFFDNLAPGTYVIAEELQPGWTQTAPGDNTFEITIQGSETIGDIDFGNVESQGINSKPTFTSAPPTDITAGELFRYDAVASDPDGDPLTFELLAAPPGMTVDPRTGTIVWIAQEGISTALLEVNDGKGGVAIQDISLNVPSAFTAPLITSTPPGPASVELPYQYQIVAQDARNTDLTFELIDAPIGVQINSDTGLVSWTPNVNQIGPNEITISARIPVGLETQQTFTIDVVANSTNQLPVIQSTPREMIHLGGTYLYQLIASDPNGDPLAVTLNAAPTGMSLNDSNVITWNPTGNQIGLNTVQLIVDDGRGGLVQQNFEIEVTSQSINESPVIESTPNVIANANQQYAYDAQAFDPDGDPLIWRFLNAPTGMSIDERQGTVLWQPTLDQVGSYDIVIEVLDAQGGADTQSFTLNVRGLNTPPIITSAPLTVGAADTPYTDQIIATDIDNDLLTYSFVNAPSNMTIDTATGQIQWTPTTSQIGEQLVDVLVTDDQGNIAGIGYSVVVLATAPNQAPRIDSTPTFAASAGALYQYDVGATDPDGDSIQFSLVNALPGMTIDSNSGLLEWVPPSNGQFEITVVASDSSGLSSTQRYNLAVRDNAAPEIISAPIVSAAVGATYEYNVRSIDPNNDPLSIELIQAPNGMTVDNFGRVRWSPTTTDLGTESIEIRVSDPFGASFTQTYNLVVTVDQEAPLVSLFQSQSGQVDLGDTVTLVVQASDNVGVEQLSLSIDGTPIALDATGRATVTVEALGAIDAVATATDAAGNIGTDTVTLTGIDPNDVDAPVVAFTSLTPGDIFTTATDILGTVTDTNLLSYTLSYALSGTDNFVTLAEGTNPITDGLLGEFDPSILANDAYTLRLFATDTGGNEATVEQEVSVAGDLKLGNFQLSFTDLVIPVSGIPITVARTYDSLNANTTDELGYGWRLELSDTDLRTNVAESGFEADLIYNPFFSGARVYVTLPGGQREGFTFQPTLAPGLQGSFLGIFKPTFVSDSGVTSQLSVDNADLSVNAAGELFDYSTGLAYNPLSPVFGNRFILTTQDGLAYEINGTTGDLRQVADNNDNTLTFTDNGIVSSNGKSVTFERDAQGRIVAVIDPLGERIEYAYNATGDLVSFTDREDNVTQYEYDEPQRDHFLTEVIDPLNRSGVRSEYDDLGRLVKLIDASGEFIELVHNPDNFTETIRDQLVNPTVFEYDQRGNVVREVDAEGGVIERTYDANNYMLTETVFDGIDLEGSTTTFTYDAFGNSLTVTDALGNVTFNTYDRIDFGTSLVAKITGQSSLPFSVLAASTDALGNTTTNTYDLRGNLTQIAGQGNGTTTLNYDARGNLASFGDATGSNIFTYDGSGNVLTQVDAAGNVTTFTYDDNGNQLTETRNQTTPTGERSLVTISEYDAEGRLVKVTDPEGGITETRYDAVGNRVQVIDAEGRVTKFIYDDRGQLTETILPDATPNDDTDNARRRTEYDAVGRVITEIDELGRQTQFVYDKVGRLIETILPDATPDDADNPRTRTEYDLAGRVIAEIDQRGNQTKFVYDKLGRLVSTLLPDETPADDSDNPTVTTTYDDAGRQQTQTDPLGNTTTFFYDDFGRPLRQEFADGTTVSSEFDETGRLVGRTDQEGKTTQFEYDAVGRLTAVVDALNQRTEYTYDELGNLITQTDANDHVTTFEYDGLGRRTATVLALGQRSSSDYDKVGNVISTTDFNGETIVYEYDERDRLITKDFPGSASTTYAYTLIGQRESVTDARGTTTYEYDEQNRLTKRIDPDGREIGYTYDIAGNRTSVTIPSGQTSYTFDAQNRLKTVTDPDAGVTTYFYNAVGNLERTEFPNGTVEIREFDELNRLVYLENSGPSGIINSFRYTLDLTGNRIAVEEQDGRRVEYTYDDLDRLTQETIFDPGTTDPSRTISYTYDAVGNRETRDDSIDGVTTYIYDVNDRLIAETTDGEVTTYTYDDNGNTLGKSNSTESVAYDWDVENRLIAADTDGDGVNDVTNQYDSDGIRVAQTANGEETRFLIDKNRPYAQVLEEYTPGGVIKVSYVHGNDLISQDRQGERSFYHVDGLGSTRALSSESGDVSDSYLYDAFGQVLSQSGNTENSYLFAGEQKDGNLDLDYLRARYLDVANARFSSRDKFEGFFQRPITLNRYIYANGNPTNFVDPSGNVSVLQAVLGATLLSQIISIGQSVGSLAGGFREDVDWKADLVIATGSSVALPFPVPAGGGAFIFAESEPYETSPGVIEQARGVWALPLLGLSLSPIPIGYASTEGDIRTPGFLGISQLALTGGATFFNAAISAGSELGGVSLTFGRIGFGTGNFSGFFSGIDIGADYLTGYSIPVPGTFDISLG